MLALLLAAWLLTLQGTVPQECVTVAVSQPTPVFRLKEGDVYKRGPMVSFVITEEGKVESVKLIKSSGIQRLDREILKTLLKWKYKPRPAGCGIVEIEMAVTIHFR